jgi:hypothetical protein
VPPPSVDFYAILSANKNLTGVNRTVRPDVDPGVRLNNFVEQQPSLVRLGWPSLSKSGDAVQVTSSSFELSI